MVGSETYQRRQLSDIQWLVIHHSAVDVDSSALTIARYHAQNLGWPGIGYHFVVHSDGSIDYVGDIQTIRYNVAGLNIACVGICLPGNFIARWPWPRQLDSTRRLLQYLRKVLPHAGVVGHRDIALPGHGTECPGDTWPGWKDQLE